MTIENIQGASSTQYAIIRDHQRDEGLLQLPVYGPAGTRCKIVRHHAPMETLTIYWLAEKEGGQPTLPDPKLFDSNNVFLYGGRSAQAPLLLPSLGAHTWKLWGEYHYAVLVPVGLNTNFNTGIMPIDVLAGTFVEDTTIAGDRWQIGLLDSLASASDQQPGSSPLVTPTQPLPPPFILNPLLDPNTMLPYGEPEDDEPEDGDPDALDEFLDPLGQ